MFASMRNLCASLTVIAVVGSANAAVDPFTEDFNADASNWRQADSVTPMAWSAAGGPDGGAHTSATFNFITSGPGATPAIIRGQDSFDSSGDAFVGNWLPVVGVPTLSFDIRHDAGVPMTIFSRVATSGNFPGAGAIEFTPVQSGVWTTISFPILPANWFMEGPFAFESVFGAVGNVQIGADPGALANVDQDVVFDIDKITITPTPGALALASVCGIVGLRRRRH